MFAPSFSSALPSPLAGLPFRLPSSIVISLTFFASREPSGMGRDPLCRKPKRGGSQRTPKEGLHRFPYKSGSPQRSVLTGRNLRTWLPPSWTLTLTVRWGSPGLLSGMLVLGCKEMPAVDNGQKLDFLVWLLPPRPLECGGVETTKRPWGLGVGRWRPDHLTAEEGQARADHHDREPSCGFLWKARRRKGS